MKRKKPAANTGWIKIPIEEIVVPPEFTQLQRSLWIEIQCEKKQPKPDMKKISALAHKLSGYELRKWENAEVWR